MAANCLHAMIDSYLEELKKTTSRAPRTHQSTSSTCCNKSSTQLEFKLLKQERSAAAADMNSQNAAAESELLQVRILFSYSNILGLFCSYREHLKKKYYA